MGKFDGDWDGENLTGMGMGMGKYLWGWGKFLQGWVGDGVNFFLLCHSLQLTLQIPYVSTRSWFTMA